MLTGLPARLVGAIFVIVGIVGFIGNIDEVHALLDQQHPHWLVVALKSIMVPHPWDAVIVLFGAAMLVVAIREARRTNAPPSASALAVPDIRAEIVEVNTAPVSGMTFALAGSSPNDTLMTVIVKVRSLAAPSTVDTWSLRLRLADGSTVIVERLELPAELRLADAFGKTQKVIYAVDALYDKTIQAPLAAGHVMYGALLFHVRRATAEIQNPATVMILGWNDVTGKHSTAEKTVGSMGGTTISTYPGMKR